MRGRLWVGCVIGVGLAVALGEVAFDVSILQPPYPEVLASGNVVTSSATPLAGAAVGVGVKQGAAKPDLSTPEAVKRMLLAANSIYYPAAAGGAALSIPSTPNRPGGVLQGRVIAFG